MAARQQVATAKQVDGEDTSEILIEKEDLKEIYNIEWAYEMK